MARIPVVAQLRLPDGREFSVTIPCESQYADGQVFWWTEGNASCDCNRKLFLDREYGLGIDDGQCGETITLVSLTVDGVRQQIT